MPACSPPQCFQHRWDLHSFVPKSPDCKRSRVEGRSSVRVRMRRACAAAGRQRPDRRGRLLRGRRGGLDGRSRSRRSSGRWPRSAVGGAAERIGACVQSAVACTGKELETYVGRAGMLCVSARFVALLGSRRPEQRQQLQRPVRNELRRLIATSGAPGVGSPAVAGAIAAALGLDAAATASGSLLATASCAYVRCFLGFVICRMQALDAQMCR